MDHAKKPGFRRSLARSLGPQDRVAALAIALDAVGNDEVEDVALELIEIAVAPGDVAGSDSLISKFAAAMRIDSRAAATEALIARWSRLPVHLRSLTVVAAEDRIAPAIAEAASSNDVATRLSAARFITDTADASLAQSLPELLKDRDDRVSRAAEAAVVRIALAAAPETDPAMLGEDLAKVADRRLIRAADSSATREDMFAEAESLVADVAWSFADHRRRGVLIAAILLADPARRTTAAKKIMRLIKDASHPAHSTIRSTIRHGKSPFIRARAWQWLPVEGVATVSAERVGVAATQADHTAVLGSSHLMLRPARRAAAARVAIRPARVAGQVELPTDAPLPTPEMYATLDADSRRGVVRLAGVLGGDAEIRRGALAPTLTDPDPMIRLAAVAMVGPVELVDFCFDSSEPVARAAAERWSSVGESRRRDPDSPASRHRLQIAASLARSPHASVRRIAAEELCGCDPWASGSIGNRVAARWLMRDDRAEFERRVHSRLIGGSPADRIAAIQLVRQLGLSSTFERELIAAAMSVGADADSRRISATAIAALATVRSPRSDSVVDAALLSEDARIRANAVEAAAQRIGDAEADEPLTGSRYGAIVELKQDAHHRVRANALRVMIEHGQAESVVSESAEILTSMLASGQPDRLAGVWLAERVLGGKTRPRLKGQWRGIAEQVATLASDDADPAVSARAQRCARKLLVEIRTSNTAVLEQA